MQKSLLILFISVCFYTVSHSQQPVFSRQDSLRGGITPERSWWDVVYYHLDIRVNPSDSTISGSNTISFKTLIPRKVMQIDLQQPMILTEVIFQGNRLSFRRDGNICLIFLNSAPEAGSINSIILRYEGTPVIAERPPWDGGITWSTDSRGMAFIGSSCQVIGASLWWPCKDHMYDEPDSMLISVNVPGELINVSNGKLRTTEKENDGSRTWHWFVSSPISTYVVNINIADYSHFSESYNGANGLLQCDYYVLKDNLRKAKNQFGQVKMMLEAFEHWFGPYPFYEDGYKLVEAPYLGMEHQSSITYGNGYSNGYLGADLSGTGWGLLFDFIIIHESGHEWFGNNITSEDIADMWIHESFTSYSECLYLEYYYGKDAASEYILGSRKNVLNDRPVIGIHNVNYPGSGDMYFKGANMLHTLRHIINDDEKWRGMLREMNSLYRHRVVKGTEIEHFLSQRAGLELKAFFDQYLRDSRIPQLEYYIENNNLVYRWSNCVEGFDMPVGVKISGKDIVLYPSTGFKYLAINDDPVIELNENYYVTIMELNAK